jgi:hypothetical protein
MSFGHCPPKPKSNLVKHDSGDIYEICENKPRIPEDNDAWLWVLYNGQEIVHPNAHEKNHRPAKSKDYYYGRRWILKKVARQYKVGDVMECIRVVKINFGLANPVTICVGTKVRIEAYNPHQEFPYQLRTLDGLVVFDDFSELDLKRFFRHTN